MPVLGVKDIKNQDAGSLELSEERFGIKGKDALMHGVVVNYLANQRQGTAATKSKGLVSGGGKKPYRQKGTGRARAGSVRSPLWKGGGTVFGPQPRDYGYTVPRKTRRQALYAALSGKISSGEVVVVDGLGVEGPRTRKMVDIIKALGLDEGSLLVVTDSMDRNVYLSARNIPGVNVKVAADLHAYDVLSHGRVLATRSALEAMDKGGEG